MSGTSIKVPGDACDAGLDMLRDPVTYSSSSQQQISWLGGWGHATGHLVVRGQVQDSPTTKTYLVQNGDSSEAEKPWLDN